MFGLQSLLGAVNHFQKAGGINIHGGVPDVPACGRVPKIKMAILRGVLAQSDDVAGIQFSQRILRKKFNVVNVQLRLGPTRGTGSVCLEPFRPKLRPKRRAGLGLWNLFNSGGESKETIIDNTKDIDLDVKSRYEP